MIGTVLQLQDTGTWGPVPSFPPVPIQLSRVRFWDQMHGWIVGFGAILYTADGGRTWRFCTGQG